MRNKELGKYVALALPVALLAAFLASYFYKLSLVMMLLLLLFLALVVVIFRRPVFGVYIVAFFLPFERVGSFDAGGFTIRASQIFALVTLISLLAAFFTRRIKINAKNPLIIPSVLFLGIALLSLVNAVNVPRGLIVFGFVSFVIIISIIIPNLVRDKQTLVKVVKIIIISALLVSLFGVYQFLGDMAGLPHELTGLREHYTQKVFGFPRVQSTALEPLYFANYLLIPISLLLALLLFKKNPAAKTELPFKPIWLFAVLALAVLNLILTVSRGAYLALAGVGLLTVLIYFKEIMKPKRIMGILLLLAFALAGTYGFLLVTGKTENITTYIEHTTSYQEGAGVVERYQTYEDAFDMIWRHPWLGVGIGNFGPEVAQIPWLAPKDGWLIVNNEALELWAETGIFGLFAIVLIIVMLIIRTIAVFRQSCDPLVKTLLVGMMIALFGIIIQYQTFSILYIVHIWFLIGLIVATQNICLNTENKR